MRREEENKPSCSMIAVSRKRDVSEIGDNQAAQDEDYAKCRFQPFLPEFLIYRYSRGKTVEDTAYHSSVALAENGEGNARTKCIFQSCQLLT